MQTYKSEVSEPNVELDRGSLAHTAARIRPERNGLSREIRIGNVLYPVALVVAVGTWFFAIRIPLWLDETVSYWQISGGFWQIWARQGLSFPAHSYILWITTILLGSSEIVLRIPSILAMLAAAYVLYCSAREFFEGDVALTATVVFCVYPTIIFAAIDARPYAFGVLAVSGAILCLLRWMRTNTTKWAILFGIAAGLIFYFHYLFGVILVAFALLLLLVKGSEWKSLVPQAAKALAAFALVMLPVVPGLVYLFRTSQSHVFSAPPNISYLTSVFAPGHMLELFAVVALIAAATGRVAVPDHGPRWAGQACLLLAIIPIAILYGVSTATSVHIFVERYRLVAVPGIALCWGLLLSRINSRAIRLLFCLGVVALAAMGQFEAPGHGYTWKYALQVANAHTSSDHAPLLVCSDLPEADHQPMPADPSTSGLFGQLSYYKVSSPVVPLPRALNAETKTQISKFLSTAAPARQRFLVVAFAASQQTVRWIAEAAKDSYTPHALGVYDGVSVIEYTPR